MNRSLRFLLVLAALTAAVSLGGAAAAQPPPNSPLIKLNTPANGSVVPGAPGSHVAFTWTVDWAKIDQKYAKWGGSKSLFYSMGMNTDVPGTGLFLGKTLAPPATSVSWTVAEIFAAMDTEHIPHDKRVYWSVILRPHNTASPDTTDRTEASFGFGPAPTPTPLVVSASPHLALKPTATPAPARSGGASPGLQLAPTPTKP
jgi:hypothetical protein